MSTAHIGADPGEFARDVILPGDPRRAKHIAERVLEGARLVTDVRGILGYTGTHEGHPVSVMASGMGIPSLSIYATELARFYGVERIIRVGTSGGLSREVAIGDVVIASSAHTDSGLIGQAPSGCSLSYAADPELLFAAMTERARLDGGVHVGSIFSTDFFYSARPDIVDHLRAIGTLAVEMEAAGLYAVGLRERVRTLTITTVADHTLGGAELTSSERERTFDRAVGIALATFAA
jgi:purine-nucleoside phosphorylase